MITKTFEIRDRMTFIPVLAIKLEADSEEDRYLFARAGFGVTLEQQSNYILLALLSGDLSQATSDPYAWGDRTRQQAHIYINENFDLLKSGDVVDVEFILEETTSPKSSERLAGM